MAQDGSADGKNSLLGEFLVALARAPETVQEAVIIYGLKHMRPYQKALIDPYPMMSHMVSILDRRGPGDDEGSKKKN
jgi:hypothetical protein